MAPPPLREAEADSVTEGESNTQGVKKRGGGGGISPGVEMEGTVAAVHPRQYLLKSNPLLMCVCSTAQKGNGNKVILLHTAQRKRERQTENA